jgi:predicted membrane protein
MKRNAVLKAVWGLYLIGAAALLIANAMYDLMGFWHLTALVAAVPVTILSITYRQYGTLFIIAAILGVIFAQPLGIEAITPLPLLGAGVLLAVAFSVLFGNSINFHTKINGTIEDTETSCVVNLGHSTKYFKDENLESVEIKCNMGGVEAYFTDATLSPKGATLLINATMSGVELHFPKSWNVINNANVFLGAVEESGKHDPEPDAPTLTIVGNVNLSGVEIKYV